MENIPVKLASQSVPEFNYFVDNQVLTAGQLNNLTDYFDRQHRLSRARLFGAGIVSGLQLRRSGNSIGLSKGVGLTSDGDLIVVPEDRVFTRFRRFSDSQAKYEHWNNVDLLELISNDQDLEGSPQALSQLPNPDRLAAVLYLESFLRPPEDCTDTDCDNLGPKQMNQLRVLLIPEAELAKRISQSGLPISPVLDVAVRRVRMGGSPILGANDLGNRFEAAIDASADDFRLALQFAIDHYAAAAQTPAGFGGDWLALFNTMVRVRDLNNGVQNVYAAMKDLADALSELQASAAEINTAAFLLPNAFPKHIALGELAAAGSGTQPTLRQYFIESLQLNRGDKALQELQTLLRRIDLMLRSFNALGGGEGLRITPSKQGVALGERAIPEYFRSNDKFPLHECWNFKKTQLQNTGAIRSYHARHYSNRPSAIDPLNFSHDDCTFYRVEGMLGLEKDAVLLSVATLRNNNNLPFRVEGIQIEQDTGRITLPPRFKLPMWEGAWHFQREQLFDKIQLAKDYALDLENTTIDIDPNDASDVSAKIQIAKTSAREIAGNLDTVTQALYVSPKSFTANYDNFKKPYNEAINKGYSINKNIQQFAQTPTESPLHQFAIFNNSFQLDRLMDISNKKIEGVKRQLIFDNFQNNHPGMEYLGGVPAGGTLVIVHQNDRVVAGFALPYSVEFDLDPEVEITPPQNGTAKPPTKVILSENFKWIDKLNKYKDIGISSLVLPQINTLQLATLEIATIKQKVESTDSFVQTWLPQLGGGRNTPPVVGNLGLIGDLTLDTRVNRANLLGQVIQDLEKQENLTAEQNQMLIGLRGELDKETAGVVGYIAQNKLEVSVGSDAFIALNLINNSVKNLSETTRNNLTLTKDLQTNEAVVSNPNLHIMVTGFKLRN